MRALARFFAWLIAVLGMLFAWNRRRGGAAPDKVAKPSDEGTEDAGGGDSGGIGGSEERKPAPVIPPAVAYTRVMRLVNGEELVFVLPNAIPTPYRGRIGFYTDAKSKKTFVRQALPHPGGKDYLLYPLEDMPISEEELRRASWMQSTVVITLQNGRVVEAHVPRGQEWGRGLWQQRSWYRGGR